MSVEHETEKPGPASLEADRSVGASSRPATPKRSPGWCGCFRNRSGGLLPRCCATATLPRTLFSKYSWTPTCISTSMSSERILGPGSAQSRRNRLRKELRTASREDRRLAHYRERLSARLQAEACDHTDDSDAYIAALRGCRQLLTERDDAMLKSRYESGMSFEEIAAQQGQTPDAVQRMISRIRSRLRDCIQNKLANT